MSDEEISMVIMEAEAAGVLESHEREMISGVMRLADRTVIGLMTPRTDVDWLDVSTSQEEIEQQLIETPHSLIPVGEGSIDTLIGVVRARELLAAILSGHPLDIRTYVRKVPIIPKPWMRSTPSAFRARPTFRWPSFMTNTATSKGSCSPARRARSDRRCVQVRGRRAQRRPARHWLLAGCRIHAGGRIGCPVRSDVA